MTSPNTSASTSVTSPSHPALLTALTLYVLPLSLGTAGNAGIVQVIVSHKALRTGMNAYIANMAVLDFLACILLVPLRVVFYVAQSTLAGDGGQAMCRAEVFLQSVADAGRMLLLGAVSFERYQAVASPFPRDRAKGSRRTALTLAILWCLVLVYAAVLSVFFHDTVMYEFCMEQTTASLAERSSGSTDVHPSTSASVSSSVEASLAADAFGSVPTSSCAPVSASVFTTASNPTSTSALTTASTSASGRGGTWDWGLWGGIEMYFVLPLSAVMVATVVVSYALMFRLLRTQRVKMQGHGARSSQVAPAPSPSILPAPSPSSPPAPDPCIPPSSSIRPAFSIPSAPTPEPNIPSVNAPVPNIPSVPTPDCNIRPDPTPDPNIHPDPSLDPNVPPDPTPDPNVPPDSTLDPNVPSVPNIPSAPTLASDIPPAPMPFTDIPSAPTPALDIPSPQNAILPQPLGLTVVHVKRKSLLHEGPLAAGREEISPGVCTDTEGSGMSQLREERGQRCAEGSPDQDTCVPGVRSASVSEGTAGSAITQAIMSPVLVDTSETETTKGPSSTSAKRSDSVSTKRPSPISNSGSLKRSVSSSTQRSVPALTEGPKSFFAKGPNSAPTKEFKSSLAKGPNSFSTKGVISSPVNGTSSSPKEGSHTSPKQVFNRSMSKGSHSSSTTGLNSSLTKGKKSSPTSVTNTCLTEGHPTFHINRPFSAKTERTNSSTSKGSNPSHTKRLNSPTEGPNAFLAKEPHSSREDDHSSKTTKVKSTPSKGPNISPQKMHNSPARKALSTSPSNDPHLSGNEDNSALKTENKEDNSALPREDKDDNSALPTEDKEDNSTLTREDKEVNSTLTIEPNVPANERNPSPTKGPDPAPLPTAGGNNPGTYSAVVRVVEMDGSAHVQQVSARQNIQGDVCLFNPRNKVQGRRRVEVRVAKRLVAIFLTFLFLWLPYPLAVVSLRVLYVRRWEGPGLVGLGGGGEKGRQVVVDVVAVVAALSTVTAAVNPLLYGLANVHIRSSARRSLRAFCGCLRGSAR